MKTVEFTVTHEELLALGATEENMCGFEEQSCSELEEFLDTIILVSGKEFDFFSGFTVTFDVPDDWAEEDVEKQYLEDLGFFFANY